MGKGSYTIVGNPVRGAEFSSVILNRGSYYTREQDIQQILSTGVQEIIIVVHRKNAYDAESLCHRFPLLRVLLYDGELSVGEMLNITVDELHAPYVLVVWNDVVVRGLQLSHLEKWFQSDVVVVAPRVYDSYGEMVPTRYIPHWERAEFNLQYEFSMKGKELTLFPHDYMGVYQRSGFQLLGGFDSDILVPFWQLTEFGIRLAMSDSSCMLISDWQIMSQNEQTIDDRDPYYAVWIYLKLFLPDWKSARLSLWCLFSGLWYAWRQHLALKSFLQLFFRVRRWVLSASFFPKKEARTVITAWQEQE